MIHGKVVECVVFTTPSPVGVQNLSRAGCLRKCAWWRLQLLAARPVGAELPDARTDRAKGCHVPTWGSLPMSDFTSISAGASALSASPKAPLSPSAVSTRDDGTPKERAQAWKSGLVGSAPEWRPSYSRCWSRRTFAECQADTPASCILPQVARLDSALLFYCSAHSHTT